MVNFYYKHMFFLNKSYLLFKINEKKNIRIVIIRKQFITIC